MLTHVSQDIEPPRAIFCKMSAAVMTNERLIQVGSLQTALQSSLHSSSSLQVTDRRLSERGYEYDDASWI